MARGRMISRSLGGSRKFSRLRSEHPTVGLFAQALYPLLVATSDDFGRQQGDAFSVRMAAWPAAPEDETAFDEALEALNSVGLIVRYAVSDETYIQVVDFDEHQSGLHKRTASKFPAVPLSSGKFPEIPGDSALIEQNR